MNDINSIAGTSLGNVGTDLQADKIYKTNKKTGDSSIKATTQDGDKVMFSQEALKAAQISQEVAKLTELVKAMPENVDEARITEISTKVKSGEYVTPDMARMTAKKMLEAMEDN